MIVVHHLNESRSQRVLWLLEELGVPYDIAFYRRDAHNMAPPELKDVTIDAATTALLLLDNHEGELRRAAALRRCSANHDTAP